MRPFFIRKKVECLEVNRAKVYFEVLNIVDEQSKTIKKQAEYIEKITIDNLEKENMINNLLIQSSYRQNVSRKELANECNR